MYHSQSVARVSWKSSIEFDDSKFMQLQKASTGGGIQGLRAELSGATVIKPTYTLD